MKKKGELIKHTIIVKNCTMNKYCAKVGKNVVCRYLHNYWFDEEGIPRLTCKCPNSVRFIRSEK